MTANDELLGNELATTDLAVRALTALLALGHADLVEQIKNDAIAHVGDNADDLSAFDENAVREAGRLRIMALVEAVLIARQQTGGRHRN